MVCEYVCVCVCVGLLNAGDNPLDINPPEKPPPQYLQNDWLERLLRIYRFIVLFHFLKKKLKLHLLNGIDY